MKKEVLYKEESYQIIGASFEVYNEMGTGFLEAVYQECLGLEFELRSIPFDEMKELPVCYKSKKLRQRYVCDFVCFDKIIVELKATKHIADEHRAQIINYLKATGNKLGLLINFGNPSKLEYERFINLAD